VLRRAARLVTRLGVETQDRWRLWRNRRPVIVLGNQKSGTTVIAALLSEISGLPVTLDLHRLTSQPRLHLVRSGQIDLATIIRDNRDCFSRPIIKEPSLTFFYPELRHLFPRGRFLFIVRDPRDNIRSILDRLKLPGDLKGISPERFAALPVGWQYILDTAQMGTGGANYIENLARRWNAAAQVYLDNRRHMLLLRYEDFCRDKAGCIADTARALGLEVRHDISGKVDRQYQSRGNRDARWPDVFGEGNLRLIESTCGALMAGFGYAAASAEQLIAAPLATQAADDGERGRELTRGAGPRGYEPRTYWNQRLAGEFSLRGVGHLGFGSGYNAWIYRRKQRCLERALRNHPLGGARVLDVGCGTGFFVRWYQERGAVVDGLDITDVSIRRLGAQYPGEFRVQDIGAADYRPARQYDIVNAWDVIYHIVDRQAYERAMTNLAASMAPGGMLLLTDRLADAHDTAKAAHVRLRCLATYQRILTELGYVLVEVRPLFRMLNRRLLGALDDRLAPVYFCADCLARRPRPGNLCLGIWRMQRPAHPVASAESPSVLPVEARP
jgi:2-polyprenyl-3-methyl-5-hydroxy-6-metoxy-1,4-benzoquinol methylase